jgi:hypothetical protein
VEATAFMSDKVTDDTALRNEPPKEEVGGQAYGMLTAKIAEKADSKHYQFASLGKPGVLAIASGHQWASLVLNRYAAECLIPSEPYWLGTKPGMFVNLSLSAFMRHDGNGGIEAYHTGLSAVLLIAVGAESSSVCGALHPKPDYPFNPVHLWEIPFVYSKDWPIERMRVRCEGTLGNTRVLTVAHDEILLD